MSKVKELTLPSGAKAQIIEGKGKHARQATKLMSGDSSLYMPALMSQLVTIDGKKMVMEDFDEIPLVDYNAIAVELSETTFLSAAKT